MTWNFLFKRLICQGTCKWIKTIWCYLNGSLSITLHCSQCIVPFWVGFLMKVFKLLEVYFTVCCLHSHWTFNFLCSTKEFLILSVFHRRGELNTTLQESLKYSRDCNDEIFFLVKNMKDTVKDWHLRDLDRIRKLILSLLSLGEWILSNVVFTGKILFPLLWGCLDWRLLQVQNRCFCWVYSEFACFFQYPRL